MKQLDEALERIKPYISNVVENGSDQDNIYRGPESYGYFTGGADRPVGRLRLDWELADAYEEKDPDKIADLMIFQMSLDLEDLIVNGDVEGHDSLFKVMDGEKKLGKKVSEIDIFSAALYQEYKERKKATEYTLFILMAVKFD